MNTQSSTPSAHAFTGGAVEQRAQDERPYALVSRSDITGMSYNLTLPCYCRLAPVPVAEADS